MPQPRKVRAETSASLAATNGHRLDLDELMGAAPLVVVRWKGVDYELRQVSGFDPDALLRFDKIQKRIVQIKSELNEESAPVMASSVHDALDILCPDLAAQEMPFMYQLRILEHYASQMTMSGEKKARRQRATPLHSAGAS